MFDLECKLGVGFCITLPMSFVRVVHTYCYWGESAVWVEFAFAVAKDDGFSAVVDLIECEGEALVFKLPIPLAVTFLS